MEITRFNAQHKGAYIYCETLKTLGKLTTI